jgi:hypothetical protein
LLASGGDDGEALPFIASASNTSLNIANAGGKVALVSKLDLITDLSDADIIDFVGYGNANEYEGSSAAHSLNNTTSIRRKDNSGGNTYGLNGNGFDTDDNGSDFYVESDLSNNPPLPVELVSFNFILNRNDVILNWKTATEINNFGFDIERNSALQGVAWEKVGFVKGNGTSNSPKEYSYVDKSLKNKKYQYRLKQIDNDGSYTYSQIVEAVIKQPLNFSVKNFPNPFNPETRITFELPFKSMVSLRVYNLIGQEIATLVNEELEAGVYERNFNTGDLSISKTALPSGIYIYLLQAGEKTISNKMVLIK